MRTAFRLRIHPKAAGKLVRISNADDDNGAFRAGNGFVAGRPCDREGATVLPAALAEHQDPVGAALRNGWWGSFVAAGLNADGRARILRDPCGGVPCYFIAVENGFLFSSDARSLLELAGLRPAIDRDSLALALRFSDLRSERTSLEGVCELLPGQICELVQGSPPRLSTPWINKRWQSTGENPATDVRRAVVESVRYAIQGSSSPLIQLSGGLDSAIVAASARLLGAEVGAVNLVTPATEGDERSFARAVAERLGLDLHERTVRVEEVDVLTSQAAFLPRPTHRLFAQSMDNMVQKTAAAFGHDAILTGGGGDSVFSYLLPGFATADRLSRLDLVSAASTALDEAAIDQVSAWRVLRLALEHIFASRHWRSSNSFLSRDILSLHPPWNPWLHACRSWPPGKRAHMAALVTIHNYVDCFGEMSVPVCFPLLHRPVLDACLAVPARAWVERGWNRAVARQAFSDVLPEAIIRRRSKGTYERFTAEVFERNRAAIRDHLLGGVLRELEILDIQALEAWFASQQPLRSNRMLALTEAESWCRHWAG